LNLLITGMMGRDVETPASNQLCNTPAKQWTWWGGVAALIILLIALLATSLKKLKSTEYGLQYTAYSKKLDDAAKVGGLHIGPPGYEFIKFPSTQITVDLPSDICVSKDGLRINFSVTFQYQMPAEWLLPAVVKYRNFQTWAQVVEAAGNSAVHHSCSEFTVAQFQSERGVIQATMEQNLKVKLEGEIIDAEDDSSNSNGVYARAISLQLQNVELPKEYSDAVAVKQAAAEDIDLAKNQRNQEVTKADTVFLTAKEEAKIINSTAVNEAGIMLTAALSKAKETTYAYETEANLIVSVQSSLGLTVDGVLGWLSNQLLATAPSLRVTTAEPASLSRKSVLSAS
jgi:regulator of protease activity HflC (stomatin/prohibitin superfamily)